MAAGMVPPPSPRAPLSSLSPNSLPEVVLGTNSSFCFLPRSQCSSWNTQQTPIYSHTIFPGWIWVQISHFSTLDPLLAFCLSRSWFWCCWVLSWAPTWELAAVMGIQHSNPTTEAPSFAYFQSYLCLTQFILCFFSPKVSLQVLITTSFSSESFPGVQTLSSSP